MASSSCPGPKFPLQHIIHRISLSSFHLHPKCHLPQEPPAPPTGDIPSQAPPEPPQLPFPGLRGARREGALGGAVPPRQLEEPVEGPPVGLPFLFTQPGHRLLALHMLLSGPHPEPPSQEPLPQQELLSRPTLPAQRGRSDRGGGDRCGHWHQSEPWQRRGPLSGVCVHKTKLATNISAAVGAARRHQPLPLSWYSRKPLQGSHSGPDSKRLGLQRSLWFVGFPSP